MGNYTQRSGNLRENMKDMTWGQRAGYIWDLYKLPIVIVAVLLVLLVGLLTALADRDPESLFMGAAVNMTVSDEGKAYLTEDIFTMMGGTDPENQRVDLLDRYLPSMDENAQLAQTENMAMVAMISAQMLDYMLLDETALEQYRSSGIIGPLDKVLTGQQLAAFEGKLMTVTSESGEVYYGIIDISDTAFAQECITRTEKVYIAFPGNTGRADMADAFFDWLLAWED